MLRTFALGLVTLFSVNANAGAFYLRPACGSLAAAAATEKLDAEMPTAGTWSIQNFNSLSAAQDYELIMQANSRVDEGSEGALPCARVTVQAKAGATDCKIMSVSVERLSSVRNGLCK